MNVARFNFCLSHEDTEIVKKGLVIFTEQVLQEHNAVASFGYNGRGVALFGSAASSSSSSSSSSRRSSSSSSTLHPERTRGLLAAYLDNSPQMEEFFVLWDLPDYGSDRDLAAAHMQAMAAVLHCAQIEHAARCNAIVSRVIYERHRNMKSHLTSTYAPLLHSALGLVISCARCGVDGRRDIALKFLARNAPTLAVLTQKGKVVSWQQPQQAESCTSDDDNDEVLVLKTDSRCLLAVVMHTLLESADAEVLSVCLGSDSVLRKLLNSVHRDNTDTATFTLGMLTTLLKQAHDPLLHGAYKSPALDAGFQKRVLDMQAQGGPLEQTIDAFLTEYVRVLATKALKNHLLRGPLEKLLGSMSASTVPKHAVLEALVLATHPDLVKVSANAITTSWEPVVTVQFAGALGHLCTLLDGTASSTGTFSGLFNGISSAKVVAHAEATASSSSSHFFDTPLESFVSEVQHSRRQTARQGAQEARTKKAVESLITRLFPRAMSKKDLNRTISHENAALQRAGLLFLRSLLSAVERVVSESALSATAAAMLGTMLSTRLPDVATLLHLRNELIQAAFASDAVEDSAAGYLLDLVHAVLCLYIKVAGASVRATGVDVAKLIEETVKWNADEECGDISANMEKMLDDKRSAGAILQTMEILLLATQNSLCKWMGTVDEANKAAHATIVSDRVGSVLHTKPSLLARLLVMCSLNKSSENEAIQNIRKISLHVLRGACAETAAVESEAWLDLAGSSTAAIGVTDFLLKLGHHWGPSVLAQSADFVHAAISPTLCTAVAICSSDFAAVLSRVPGGSALKGKGRQAAQELRAALTHVALVHGQNVANVISYTQSLEELASHFGVGDQGADKGEGGGTEIGENQWEEVTKVSSLLLDCLSDDVINVDDVTKRERTEIASASASLATPIAVRSAAHCSSTLQESASCKHLTTMLYLRLVHLGKQQLTSDVLAWIGDEAEAAPVSSSLSQSQVAELLMTLLTLQQAKAAAGDDASSASSGKRKRSGSTSTLQGPVRECEKKIASALLARVDTGNYNSGSSFDDPDFATTSNTAAATAAISRPTSYIVSVAMLSAFAGKEANAHLGLGSSVCSLASILRQVKTMSKSKEQHHVEKRSALLIGACAAWASDPSSVERFLAGNADADDLMGVDGGSGDAVRASVVKILSSASASGAALQEIQDVTQLRATCNASGLVVQLEDPLSALSASDPILIDCLRAVPTTAAAAALLSAGPAWRTHGTDTPQSTAKGKGQSVPPSKKKKGDSKPEKAIHSATLQQWATLGLLVPASELLSACPEAAVAAIASMVRNANDAGRASLLSTLKIDEAKDVLQAIITRSFSVHGNSDDSSAATANALFVLLSDASVIASHEVDIIVATLVQASLRSAGGNHNIVKLELSQSVAELSLLVMLSPSTPLSRNAANAWVSLMTVSLQQLTNYIETSLAQNATQEFEWSIAAAVSRASRILVLLERVQSGPTCILQVPLEDDDWTEQFQHSVHTLLVLCVQSALQYGATDGPVAVSLRKLFRSAPDASFAVELEGEHESSETSLLTCLLENGDIDNLLEKEHVLELVLIILGRGGDLATGSSVDRGALLTCAKVLARTYTATMCYSDRLKARIVWILFSASISPPMQALCRVSWDGEVTGATSTSISTTSAPHLSIRHSVVVPTLGNFPAIRTYVPQPLVELEGNEAAAAHKQLLVEQLREAREGWTNSKSFLKKEREGDDGESNMDVVGSGAGNSNADDAASVASSDDDSDSSDDDDDDSSLSSIDSDDEELLRNASADAEAASIESYAWHLHEDFKEQRTGTATSLDPSFWLPALLLHLQAGEPSVRRLTSSGMLALPLASLCSECPILRGCAQACLSRLMHLLRAQDASKDVSFRERPQLLLLMEFTRNAILPGTAPNAEVGAPILPAQAALFLARASTVLLHVGNELYSSVSRYLLSRPFCDIKDTPLWDIVVTDGTNNDARLIALRGIRDGLVAHKDHLSLCRKHGYQRLMSMFSPLSHADTRTGHAILDIFDVAIRQRANSRYLLERCSLVAWLVQVTSLVGHTQGSSLCRGVASPRLLPRLLLLLRRAAAANCLLVRTDRAADVLPALQHCALLLATQSAHNGPGGRAGSHSVLGKEAIRQLVLLMWDVTVLQPNSGNPTLVWDVRLLGEVAATVRSVLGASSDVEMALGLLAATSLNLSSSAGISNEKALAASSGDDNVSLLLHRLLRVGSDDESVSVPQVAVAVAAPSQSPAAPIDGEYASVLDAVRLTRSGGSMMTSGDVAATVSRQLWATLSRWDPVETALPTFSTQRGGDGLWVASLAARALLSHAGGRENAEQCARWAVFAHKRQLGIPAVGGGSGSVAVGAGVGALVLSSRDETSLTFDIVKSTLGLGALAAHATVLCCSCESLDKSLAVIAPIAAGASKDVSTHVEVAASVLELCMWLASNDNKFNVCAAPTATVDCALGLVGVSVEEGKEGEGADMDIDGSSGEGVLAGFELRSVHARGFLFDAGKWRNNVFAKTFADLKA